MAMSLLNNVTIFSLFYLSSGWLLYSCNIFIKYLFVLLFEHLQPHKTINGESYKHVLNNMNEALTKKMSRICRKTKKNVVFQHQNVHAWIKSGEGNSTNTSLEYFGTPLVLHNTLSFGFSFFSVLHQSPKSGSQFDYFQKSRI